MKAAIKRRLDQLESAAGTVHEVRIFGAFPLEGVAEPDLAEMLRAAPRRFCHGKRIVVLGASPVTAEDWQAKHAGEG